jgi:hypothetical protein
MGCAAEEQLRWHAMASTGALAMETGREFEAKHVPILSARRRTTLMAPGSRRTNVARILWREVLYISNLLCCRVRPDSSSNWRSTAVSGGRCSQAVVRQCRWQRGRTGSGGSNIPATRSNQKLGATAAFSCSRGGKEHAHRDWSTLQDALRMKLEIRTFEGFR